MISSKRLYTLLKLAKLKTLKQQVQLAKAQQKTQTSQEQLQQLEKYQQEYFSKVSQIDSVATTDQWLLSNQNRFFKQIDEGILIQTNEYDRYRQRQDDAMKDWHKAHQYSQQLADMAEQSSSQERDQAEKSQQKKYDEAFIQSVIYRNIKE